MKALIIVDIQEYYKQFLNINYLNKLKTHIDNYNYDKIIVLLDSNKENYEGDFIPDFLTNYNYSFKIYDDNYSKNNLNRYSNKNVQLSLIPDYDKLDNGALIHGVKNGRTYVDYIDENLYNIVVDLKNYEMVNIVGGVREQCVEKTKTIINSFNSNVNILENLCFTNNLDESLLTNIKWSFINNNSEEIVNYFK